LLIQGIGKVKLEINISDSESNEFLISDIYYIPTVRINIILPDVLLDKSGIYSIWIKQGIILIDKEGDEIASTIRWNGIWKLQVQDQDKEIFPGIMLSMVNTLTNNKSI